MSNIKNKPFANFRKREFSKIIRVIFLENIAQNSQTGC